MRWWAAPIREAYRREVIPAELRWWLTAGAMRDWLRLLSSKLRPHHDDARALTARIAAEMFRRRWAVLSEARPDLTEKDLGRFMAGLYQIWQQPRAGWIFAEVGGAPASLREHVEALRLARRLDAEARWRETTVHLGELLIVFTEVVPAELPRARQILAQICFDLGVAYGGRACALFGFDPQRDPAARAIEVLRMSEYLFRVNPRHLVGAEGSHGYIEGDACPWYSRPGWEPGHCGIFGQFQNGVSSVFGLKYRLTRTIPRHGGDVCRVELTPLRLSKS
jgi:hypothetical protein